MGRAFEYRRAAKEKRWDKMSKMFPKLGKAIPFVMVFTKIDKLSSTQLQKNQWVEGPGAHPIKQKRPSN